MAYILIKLREIFTFYIYTNSFLIYDIRLEEAIFNICRNIGRTCINYAAQTESLFYWSAPSL
jgi:hypothetical protein